MIAAKQQARKRSVFKWSELAGHYREYGVMTTKVGFGSYQYQLAEGWPKLPRKGVVSDVAIDSKGMAYVALRASTIFPICSSARSHGIDPPAEGQLARLRDSLCSR